MFQIQRKIKMFQVGDKVKAEKMDGSSMFIQVIGEVHYIRNGYVGIIATSVMSKTVDDGTFTELDNPCFCAAKVEYVVKM